MDEVDEATALALALSLSEAEASGGGARRASAVEAADEALARRLQAELDDEQGPQTLPAPPASSAAAAHPRQQAAPLPLPADPNTCAGCGHSLRGPLGGMFSLTPGRYLNALGRSWHPDCLRCAACSQPLTSAAGERFSIGDDRRPYHPACHKQLFHPRCDVCASYLPTSDDNRIVWSSAPFWGDKACPAHSEDGTRRCTACARMQPRAEQWTELEDGRALCLRCLGTAVVDTADCQPLYRQVLEFFRRMGMALPAVPPLMLVDDAALNAAVSGETSGRGRGGGPVFHTRGLCLTEYSQTVRTVVRRGGGLFSFAALGQQEVTLGPTRCEVTAILVLFGLPRLLTGSILAHECMHAWLRLGGCRHLAPRVEEGLCQLMALLWLEAQGGDPQRQQQMGSRGADTTASAARPPAAAATAAGAGAAPEAYEERLAAFFGHQIRTDQSEVYGEGFRDALDAFQRVGLAAVLERVRATGQLP